MADTHDDTRADGKIGDAPPSAPASPPADPVAALVASGDHPAAARLAAAGGDLPRAIALYERAWRFADALPLALRLGDAALAIRLALDAGDRATASRVAAQIPSEAVPELRAASSSFASRGDHWEAARMAERAGDLGIAAGYFRRAGSLLDLGRMEELSGQPREAGIAYEQALAEASGPQEAAAARLALGRLLARLGRHEDAARAFQRAMPEPRHRLAAGRALTAALVRLGFRVAAAEIVRRLRSQWPDLPDSPDEIAALDAADISASASTVGQLGATPGLLRQRFMVLRMLGAGATSNVYLAEDVLLGETVALKLLSVGAGGVRGAERQAYVRFTREAEAAGRLRHPNIVALHDADPGMGLFVLELMSGGTLADRLMEQKVLSPTAVRRLALDLLSALGAAHEAGMVHRDVKPANILFDAVGNAKLGDFGAAHLVDFGQTQTGGLLGTVAYMSPEQISGGTIGPSADLYALGVTLFEALTGRLPFPGPDIVAQHLAEEPPAPSACVRAEVQEAEPTARAATAAATATTARRLAVTEAHDRVLLRALRKAPSERWHSAAQMAEAIRSWPAETEAEVLPDSISAIPTNLSNPSAIPIDSIDSIVPVPGSTPRLAPVAGAPGSGGATDELDLSRGVPLGRSASGWLWRRDDPNLGRPVLVEVRDRPVADGEIERLQSVAALGGPFVQRVLTLSEDGRTVTYELGEGPRAKPSDLSVEEAAEVARASARLDELDPGASRGPRGVILTAGGPLLLVVEPLGEPSAGGQAP